MLCIWKKTCIQYTSDKRRQKKAEQLENIVELLENKGFTGFTAEEKNNLLYMLGKVEENMRKI